MLRISVEDELMVQQFHSVHPEAKKLGFARLFRSPTLFEDIVKSVLLCCCPWLRSLEMAQALCDLQHKFSYGNGTLHCSEKKGSKRKRCGGGKDCCWAALFKSQCMGNFPSPKEIACLDVDTLNKNCNLGYRASIILQVARNIENRSLNLGDFERPGYDYELLRQCLIKIKGFGPFTVANIMMCIGVYEEIPVDTETIKHLEEVHGKTKLNRKTQKEVIAQIYGKYAPFQCLAYWMEHVEYYEKRLGKLSELPHSKYCNVTTTNFEIRTLEN
ncbi:hypothetical protein Pfo_024626 [Paulownia fortunei]|nr:hypothetical protein Pfo_024626 [Paulownia fortunei]